MKNIWIGIDDTDSRTGGCTTYTACVLIDRLIKEKYDLIGFPRLVRLNPNIPWKTRGNGAISIKIGYGLGKKTKIGEIKEKNIFCYETSISKKLNIENVKDIVEETVEEFARLEDDNTNSGIVVIDSKPTFNIYKKTVKEIVNLKEIKEILDNLGAYYKGYKNQRGLIGATASIAWASNYDKTYEIITYRKKNKWGSKRDVDDKTTKIIDNKYPSTFDNFDYLNQHNRLVPNSPCPILYGIRGENFRDLINVKSEIKSETIDNWIIFQTNQGTDDHLQKKNISEVNLYESVVINGVINKDPFTIEGGHVIFKIKDTTGEIDCAAYEPTKEFRNTIRSLITGDKVEVYGGVRKKPLTINLEKIMIKKLGKNMIKIENPICPKCGKHMKSKGKNQGYKCIKCGKKSDKPHIKEEKRKIQKGLYEVPVCARRHLSKPLKRL